jgi:hypothetical protein
MQVLSEHSKPYSGPGSSSGVRSGHPIGQQPTHPWTAVSVMSGIAAQSISMLSAVPAMWRRHWVGEEGHDLIPSAPPCQPDGGILLAPLGLELGKALLGHLGPVDRTSPVKAALPM